jgi:hypothetical protein
MDSHASHPDDLSDLERRLAAWKPAVQGLYYEEMLFAAGRASVRGGKARFVWPVAAACFAIAAFTLGLRLAAERSELLALRQQFDQREPNTAIAAKPADDSDSKAPEAASDSYLVLRRQWEQHPESWTSAPAKPVNMPVRPTGGQPHILRAWPPAGPPEAL